MASWDAIIDEWLVATNSCVGTALCGRADYNMYAAAPVEADKGWEIMYKEPYTGKLATEDGGEKDVAITESATLKEAVETDIMKSAPSETGLWVGGKRFRVVKREEEENYVWVFATNNQKEGIHIMATATSVLLCKYDEKHNGQQSGNCKKKATEMIEYLIQNGL